MIKSSDGRAFKSSQPPNTFETPLPLRNLRGFAPTRELGFRKTREKMLPAQTNTTGAPKLRAWTNFQKLLFKILKFSFYRRKCFDVSSRRKTLLVKHFWLVIAKQEMFLKIFKTFLSNSAYPAMFCKVAKNQNILFNTKKISDV